MTSQDEKYQNETPLNREQIAGRLIGLYMRTTKDPFNRPANFAEWESLSQRCWDLADHLHKGVLTDNDAINVIAEIEIAANRLEVVS